jgi:hypothetical protein
MTTLPHENIRGRAEHSRHSAEVEDICTILNEPRLF